ncbi:MAG: AraC family transcriptional regulator, partial [bacterium]|nr:AraC family transcriptional regulator [bacterium]
MSSKSVLMDIAGEDGMTETGIPGFRIVRASSPYNKTSMIVHPSVCFINQGKKNVCLGKEVITYNEDSYLIISAQMPIEAELINASAEHPYLG